MYVNEYTKNLVQEAKAKTGISKNTTLISSAVLYFLNGRGYELVDYNKNMRVLELDNKIQSFLKEKNVVNNLVTSAMKQLPKMSEVDYIDYVILLSEKAKLYDVKPIIFFGLILDGLMITVREENHLVFKRDALKNKLFELYPELKKEYVYNMSVNSDKLRKGVDLKC